MKMRNMNSSQSIVWATMRSTCSTRGISRGCRNESSDASSSVASDPFMAELSEKKSAWPLALGKYRPSGFCRPLMQVDRASESTASRRRIARRITVPLDCDPGTAATRRARFVTLDARWLRVKFFFDPCGVRFQYEASKASFSSTRHARRFGLRSALAYEYRYRLQPPLGLHSLVHAFERLSRFLTSTGLGAVVLSAQPR